jgi:APA family basic amino acid/polyamine antiporter
MLSVLWAYNGWQYITFISGEIKNPKRTVGRASIGGIVIAMFLNVLINVAYMCVMPLPELAAVGDQELGAAVVVNKTLGNAGEIFILLLIVVSVFGSLNAVMLSHSRVYFRMVQEEFFFSKVARVNKRFKHLMFCCCLQPAGVPSW